MKDPTVPDNALFTCPRSSLCVFPQVLEEYDLSTLPDIDRPVIIDVGANVGAFSWFALQRWPGAKVYAYEPHPVTANLLRQNMTGLPVQTYERAVLKTMPGSATVTLYEGVNASTEASTRDDVRWPHLSQDLNKSYRVHAWPADRLEHADVLKIDTEGSEVEILEGYKHLEHVKVLLVEAHAVGGDLPGQMKQIATLAGLAGLRLVDVRNTTLRFVRDIRILRDMADPRDTRSGESDAPPPMSRPLPDDGPSGDTHDADVEEGGPHDGWVQVETAGGSWRVGRRGGLTPPSGVRLDPCYSISPTRVFLPIPVPGQGINMQVLDMPIPYVWGDGSAETIQVASMKALPPVRVRELLALHAQQRAV
jgi:FkbM family methyltransferase